MNGVDGSTTFTDSSNSSHSPNANGDAQIDTAQSKFDGASGLFDGNDWVNVPNHDDFKFGGDDFTIDFWVKRGTIGSVQRIVTKTTSTSSADIAFNIGFQTANTFLFSFVSLAPLQFHTVTTVTTLTDTTDWHHIACIRDNDIMKVYIEGTADVNTVDVTGKSVNDPGGDLFIGRLDTIQYFNGRLDEFRVSKGIARWTSDFTPPTKPYDDLIPPPVDYEWTKYTGQPTVINWDISPQFKTVVSEFGTGKRNRNSKWTNSKRRFTIKYRTPMRDFDIQEIFDFYIARKGSFEKFDMYVAPLGTTHSVIFADDGLGFPYFATAVAELGLVSFEEVILE